MTSVITGDIIKSERISDPTLWLDTLKSALTYLTKNSDNWELFRGDSFQIEIADITNSFEAAIYIKAALKSHKSLDARMALGIGNKSFTGKNITESNGEVFQFSGETLEQLKKEKVTFKIKTPNPKLDVELNLYFKLAFTIMDNWTSNAAEIVKLHLENPNMTQAALGKTIGITQNTVSERQKRAYLNEIMELNLMFKKKISTFLI